MSQVPWEQQLQQTLQQRRLAELYRKPRLRQSPQGVEIIVDGQPFISFCSNDYLGLANHPALKTAFIAALDDSGFGSGAAHLLSGHSHYHQQLEDALAEFTGQQRVLLYSTGYMANLGVIDGLMGRGDALMQDKLNHASLLDGGRLSQANQVRYAHNDMAMLTKRLAATSSDQHKLIVSDGVFSMDGDIAPLPEIMLLAEQYQAAVMIDDAHGFGVLGQTGAGTIEHFKSQLAQKPIVVGTFGKALGTSGAFVAADDVVIESLIQDSRCFIYTTAQPAAISAATLKSLELVQRESWRREKLATLIQRFRAGVTQLGLQLMASDTPIQPVVVGAAEQAVKWGKQLESQGFLVGVVRPPTVPNGSARLRITLSAAHSEEQVDRLLGVMERLRAH